MGDEKERFWTLANFFTLLRILAVPVLIAALVRHSGRTAFLVFGFAALTDFLDGQAARTWHQRSKLGIALDPAADKLLMTASFIALSLPSLGGPNIIPLWLTIVVIGRDVAIAVGALVLLKTVGARQFLPTLWGKISTVWQLFCVFLVLLFNWLGTTPGELLWLYLITLIATCVSWAHYFFARFLPWIRKK